MPERYGLARLVELLQGTRRRHYLDRHAIARHQGRLMAAELMLVLFQRENRKVRRTRWLVLLLFLVPVVLLAWRQL